MLSFGPKVFTFSVTMYFNFCNVKTISFENVEKQKQKH